MSKRVKQQKFADYTIADRLTKDMKLNDLKRACIARGMPFEEVVRASVPGLHSWFSKNYDNSQNVLLLNEFDDWKALELKKAGYGTTKNDGGVFHPHLRLGFIGTKDADGNVEGTRKPRLKGLKKKEKPKRTRLEGTKIFAGTKKAATYELALKYESPNKVIDLVMEKFPDANEKSILIWFKSARKEKGLEVMKEKRVKKDPDLYDPIPTVLLTTGNQIKPWKIESPIPHHIHNV